MKNFLIPLIAIFLIPIQIEAHDQQAHEICIKAKDYVGCLKANKTFTKMEKAAATGSIAALKCMERRNLISKEESDNAIREAFNSLNIPIDAKEDAQVIKVANEISYLYQVDCRTMVDSNQIKMQKKISQEFFQ